MNPPTDDVPDWIHDRVAEAVEEDGVPVELAAQLEVESAVDLFGLPLPESDPYERMARRERRERIERYERTLGPAYNRARFVGGDA